MRYSLSIDGVSSAVIGTYTVDEVKQNVEWAKRHQPMSAEEMAAVRKQGQELAATWGARFGPAACFSWSSPACTFPRRSSKSLSPRQYGK